MECFEEYSNNIQNIHFKFLEGKEYEVFQSNELHYFSLILSNYIKSEKNVIELSKKIAHSRNLYYRIIIVNCYADGETFSVPVFCVKENNNQNVFYDIDCRKYDDWEDFLSNTRLPKCLMRFPENGIYKMEGGKLKFGKRDSPACSIWKLFHQNFYVPAKVMAILASCASDINYFQPYNVAIGIVSGICNVYTAAFHGYQLYDRAKHDQSIHYSDEEALCHWLNIGSDALFFAVTVGKMKFGSPQSQDIALQNLFSMTKMITEGGDTISNLKKIQHQLLCQHLTYFTNQAMDYFKEHIINNKLDVLELIFNIRRYVLKGDFAGSKFRRFVGGVDCDILSTVASDTVFAREISRIFRVELYTITNDMSQVVEKIMQEVKNWANGSASLMQLMFRVSVMCKGLKSYETTDEMCKHFNVNQPGDIEVNGKFLFRGSRCKFLELLNVNDIEKFPQLPLYAVEYLSNHDNDNLEEFKKYFNERVANEMNMPVSPQLISVEKEWINALTLENLSYAQSVSPEGINLVKMRAGNGEEVALGDLFKLAKRLLGRVGALDMKLVRPDVNWVLVASRRSRYAVIIAPKITLEGFRSVGGWYPVFKRPF